MIKLDHSHKLGSITVNQPEAKGLKSVLIDVQTTIDVCGPHLRADSLSVRRRWQLSRVEWRILQPIDCKRDCSQTTFVTGNDWNYAQAPKLNDTTYMSDQRNMDTM